MNGENKLEFIDGLLVKQYVTKTGKDAISLRFVDETKFLDFFISKIGVYKGGLELTAYKKPTATEYSTHYIILNEKKPYSSDNIESDFSKPSESHIDEIDEQLPF